MASCSYSEFVGGACGPSVTDPANGQFISIGKYPKDIGDHLKALQVRVNETR